MCKVKVKVKNNNNNNKKRKSRKEVGKVGGGGVRNVHATCGRCSYLLESPNSKGVR